LVVLRQDGTALYPVADLALAVEKFATTDLTQSIMVVDKRQSLYFKQLFALLHKLGYQQSMIHLPYDVVTLPSGMMSSRLGNVILFTDLYQQCQDKLIAETKLRHADWSGEQIKAVAEKLTVATLKFEMIKVGAEKIITFNIDEALRFDGYTAAYLQYTGARINSLLTKAGDWSPAQALQLAQSQEKALVLILAKYGDIVNQSALNYEPSELTQYLFDLAQAFNDFYQSCQILSAESEVRASRLQLSAQVGRTLRAGLAILGIEIVQEM
jgi:arginyl-tRNA synthetase